MSSRLLPVFFIILNVLCIISADPTCRLSRKNVKNIICSPGDEDYILKKGLVSDNNETEKLTLTGCRIVDIDNEAFQGLPLLRYINLSKNKLSKIKLGALDNAKRVTHLNLSYNSLIEFPLGLFDNIPNLLQLDLKGNRIEKIELGIFDPLKKLKHLDLSSNAFLGEQLNPNIFDRSRLITFMDFSRNDMRETDENILQAFQEIDFLNLDRCLLIEVPVFATTINMKTMKKLSLSVNQISKIDNPATFVNMDSLEHLNIGWNILNSVHEDVFKPLRNLKVIVLRNNQMKRIPETLFLNMAALNNIDLSNNLITYVPVNAFRGTSVKNLNLASNRFTYLTDNFCLELRNSGTQLQKFYFNQNPWQCKCLLDILKEVTKYGIEYNSVKYDGAHPVCVSEEIDCKRHDSFNEIYVDLFNELIGKS